MGAFTSSVQQPQTGGGKGSPINQAVNETSKVVNQVSSSSAGSDQNAISAALQGSQQPQQQYQPRPMGKGGAQTNSATSGQPRMGAPNQYSNTVGQWDNTQIQPIQRQNGKGKGA